MVSLPIQPVFVFILVLIRLLTFFSFMPVFSETYVPIRFRVVTAAAAAFVFFPAVQVDPAVFPETLSEMMALMLPEALIGFAFAMVGRILFSTIQLGGNIIGDNMGFNMSQIVAPGLGGQIPLMAQSAYVFSLIVFFVVDAHHAFFAALARSFEIAPPGFIATVSDLTLFFIQRTNQMFIVAVQIAMPILTVLLVTTLGMGFLARAVPRINMFMESFPLRILIGFLMLTAIGGYILRFFADMCQGIEGDLITVLDLITS